MSLRHLQAQSFSETTRAHYLPRQLERGGANGRGQQPRGCLRGRGLQCHCSGHLASHEGAVVQDRHNLNHVRSERSQRAHHCHGDRILVDGAAIGPNAGSKRHDLYKEEIQFGRKSAVRPGDGESRTAEYSEARDDWTHWGVCRVTGDKWVGSGATNSVGIRGKTGGGAECIG